MAQPLCLLSLQYADRGMEKLWGEHQLKHALLPADSSLCLFKLGVTVFIMLSMLLGVMVASASSLALWLCYAATLAAQHALITRAPGVWAANRSLLVPLFKLLLAGWLGGLVALSVLQPADSAAEFAKVLLLGSGLVLLNCTGILMPIAWRHHWPLSLAMLAAYDATLLPALLDTLTCTPASRALVLQLSGAIDKAAHHAGGLMLALPGSPPLQGDVLQGDARLQALCLVLWLQLLLVIIVPAVYLYAHELRARTAFLMRRESGSGSSAEAASVSVSSSSSSAASAAVELLLAHPLAPGLALPHPLVLVTALLMLAAGVVWHMLALAAGPLSCWCEQGSLGFMDVLALRYGAAGACLSSQRLGGLEAATAAGGHLVAPPAVGYPSVSLSSRAPCC